MNTHLLNGDVITKTNTPTISYWLKPLFIPMLVALFFSVGCVPKQKNAFAPKPVVQKQQKAEDVVELALSHIGRPYKYGGNTPETGFDCSGLICWTYAQVGIEMPRSAREQTQFGIKVAREDLQPGDIVGFNRARGRGGYHSGIYIGNGEFVHSPRTGRTIEREKLDTKYYATRFIGARRIPRDGSAKELLAEFKAKNPTPAPAKRGIKKSPGKKSVMVASAGKKKAQPAVKARSKKTTAPAKATKVATAKKQPTKKAPATKQKAAPKKKK